MNEKPLLLSLPFEHISVVTVSFMHWYALKHCCYLISFKALLSLINRLHKQKSETIAVYQVHVVWEETFIFLA